MSKLCKYFLLVLSVFYISAYAAPTVTPPSNDTCGTVTALPNNRWQIDSDRCTGPRMFGVNWAIGNATQSPCLQPGQTYQFPLPHVQTTTPPNTEFFCPTKGK